MMLFGMGVSGQVTFSKAASCAAGTPIATATASAGNWVSISLGWSLAVFFGIVVSGGVSGAHLNPAVTVALAAFGRHPWAQVAPYVLAQTLAAFVAAAVIYAEYHSALLNWGEHCCGGHPFRIGAGGCNGAGVWTTFPQSFETIGEGFIDQVLGTALLLLGIFAINDDAQRGPGNASGPITKAAAVAALVVAIGASFGFATGYAINPARDFGPRLFTSLAGFGAQVWSAGHAWWWVPIVAPTIGGLVGAGLYEGVVGRWVQQQQDDKSDDVLV